MLYKEVLYILRFELMKQFLVSIILIKSLYFWKHFYFYKIHFPIQFNSILFDNILLFHTVINVSPRNLSLISENKRAFNLVIYYFSVFHNVT
jgi:hypothetical protein